MRRRQRLAECTDEATLLSPYVTASGKVFFNGELKHKATRRASSESERSEAAWVESSAFNAASSRLYVTDAFERNSRRRKGRRRVEAITGKQKDIFKGIMGYLNSKDNDQAEIRASSEELTEAVVDLTKQLTKTR